MHGYENFINEQTKRDRRDVESAEEPEQTQTICPDTPPLIRQHRLQLQREQQRRVSSFFGGRGTIDSPYRIDCEKQDGSSRYPFVVADPFPDNSPPKSKVGSPSKKDTKAVSRCPVDLRFHRRFHKHCKRTNKFNRKFSEYLSELEDFQHEYNNHVAVCHCGTVPSSSSPPCLTPDTTSRLYANSPIFATNSQIWQEQSPTFTIFSPPRSELRNPTYVSTNNCSSTQPEIIDLFSERLRCFLHGDLDCSICEQSESPESPPSPLSPPSSPGYLFADY